VMQAQLPAVQLQPQLFRRSGVFDDTIDDFLGKVLRQSFPGSTTRKSHQQFDTFVPDNKPDVKEWGVPDVSQRMSSAASNMSVSDFVPTTDAGMQTSSNIADASTQVNADIPATPMMAEQTTQTTEPLQTDPKPEQQPPTYMMGGGVKVQFKQEDVKPEPEVKQPDTRAEEKQPEVKQPEMKKAGGKLENVPLVRGAVISPRQPAEKRDREDDDAEVEGVRYNPPFLPGRGPLDPPEQPLPPPDDNGF
jgi:hypothetical protein